MAEVVAAVDKEPIELLQEHIAAAVTVNNQIVRDFKLNAVLVCIVSRIFLALAGPSRDGNNAVLSDA